MPAPDYDVFVCAADESASDLAAAVSSGLTRRGFRVFPAGRPSSPDDRRNFPLIEDTADFVLVAGSSGGGAGAAAGTGARFAAGQQSARRDIAQAVQTSRNIVLVQAAGPDRRDPGEIARDLGLPVQPPVIVFDPGRADESVALVAHRLSSESLLEDRKVMRRARRVFLAAGAILLAGVALQEVPRLIERWSRPALLTPVPPFALYWSVFGQRLEDGRWVGFPWTEGAALSGDDQLQLAFSPSADGFAYVVSRHEDGRVSVLFPTDAIRGASRVRAGESYVAPVGTGWLTIDEQAPAETIFLVAGYDALQNLEELVEEPESATTSGARRALLESTVAGLLDGRHGAAERTVRTGKLHPIDQNLPVPGGPATAFSTLSSGLVVEHPLAPQRGLVSASVEIRLR